MAGALDKVRDIRDLLLGSIGKKIRRPRVGAKSPIGARGNAAQVAGQVARGEPRGIFGHEEPRVPIPELNVGVGVEGPPAPKVPAAPAPPPPLQLQRDPVADAPPPPPFGQQPGQPPGNDDAILRALMEQQQKQAQMQHQEEMVKALKPWAVTKWAPDPSMLGQNLMTMGHANFGNQMQGAMGQIGDTLNRNADRMTANRMAYFNSPALAERERGRTSLERARLMRDVFRGALG